MNYATEKNNKVYVMGEIVSDKTFSHEVYGEGFYEFFLKVMRLSGQADILPVTVSERLIEAHDLKRVRLWRLPGNSGAITSWKTGDRG